MKTEMYCYLEDREPLTCRFLLMCSGYYRYDHGYLPDFAGMDRFTGQLDGRVTQPTVPIQRVRHRGVELALALARSLGVLEFSYFVGLTAVTAVAVQLCGLGAQEALVRRVARELYAGTRTLLRRFKAPLLSADLITLGLATHKISVILTLAGAACSAGGAADDGALEGAKGQPVLLHVL